MSLQRCTRAIFIDKVVARSTYFENASPWRQYFSTSPVRAHLSSVLKALIKKRIRPRQAEIPLLSLEVGFYLLYFA
jgi:hypothetical protein